MDNEKFPIKVNGEYLARTIQEAFDLLPERGGIIEIPPGTWKIPGNLLKRASLIGSCAEKTLLEF